MRISQNFEVPAAVVEDASLALLNLLDNANIFPPSFFKGKSVLDVTTGTGVIGIGLSFMGCKKCTICCSKKFFKFCDENIKKNPSLLKIEILQKELEELNTIEPVYDVIFFSGHEFNSQTFLIYKEFLLRICIEKVVVVVAYELRNKDDVEFFKVLHEVFEIQKIPNSNLDEMYRDDILGLFFMRKRK